ncbi:hypothetical protein M568_14390 [Salmonella enterica subsp. enterica serovar Namur str. 05-2929]|nr:hypothetical protein CFSAN001921_16830 [Salmonella enterica subsp. enterica serovar Typhimurium var. 5- str. CFSAN001921]AGQ80157.1 hypothetical protein CFSAN002069_08635 [Salmonella enterica subsp. enterica serovar Heidelberg str. CFSAN002069]AGQ87840.1 hypothetical protein SE451236_06605 [Salmonella enterica subsp. enterica serovar 4,[5],12:i:- str. 08-1736]AHB97695.1 hypothetical protein CFSAN002064_16705 [Salmonella enterica subsp. enterica serovar Heidelberg str. CFSAN002064]AMW93360.1 
MWTISDKRKVIKKNFRIILRNNLNYLRDIFTDTHLFDGGRRESLLPPVL